MSERYNGWTNWATWRINLELLDGDDEVLGEDVRNGHIDPFGLTIELADYIEQRVQEYLDMSQDYDKSQIEGIVRSYCDAFVGFTNWYEIAEKWIREHPYLLAENWPEGEGEWVQNDHYEWVWQPEEDE